MVLTKCVSLFRISFSLMKYNVRKEESSNEIKSISLPNDFYKDLKVIGYFALLCDW